MTYSLSEFSRKPLLRHARMVQRVVAPGARSNFCSGENSSAKKRTPKEVDHEHPNGPHKVLRNGVCSGFSCVLFTCRFRPELSEQTRQRVHRLWTRCHDRSECACPGRRP